MVQGDVDTRVTPTLQPSVYIEQTERLLGERFRLDRVIAASRERVLFLSFDRLLHRRVSLRVNIFSDEQYRTWFLTEAKALAQLDHPAIRHLYDAGMVGDVAYRVGNWVEGEGLDHAVARGPRPIPAVLRFARDLLSALEHAHDRGVIIRRIVPTSVVVGPSARGVVTDLRFSNHTLEAIPVGITPSGEAFMAPETRNGSAGDPLSDIYTAGAILYYAVTAHAPSLNPADLTPPTALRAVCPRILERVVLRAMAPESVKRYLTASEMLDDLISAAGLFETPSGTTAFGDSAERYSTDDAWEQHMRRALGDDYELLDALGEGGFGRVYRVRDLHLEREVALKVLHPFLTKHPSGVERFRREAQLAARLKHPHIVDIYDIAGRAGLLWYTMELVKGPNVAQWIDRNGPMPLDHVLRLIREALSALAHAHSSDLVHRDIKPENLLIDERGSLRITDFGLAMALQTEGHGGATSRSGTPQFASPEQLLGEPVDQRSDLYSLAVVAYYALLGFPPFSGQNTAQILAKQTTDQIPALRDYRHDVTEELEAVFERAIRNDVDARYATAAEFFQAVRQAMRASPSSLPAERVRPGFLWWRPRRSREESP
jgi:serine/threonine protein kinase